MADLDLTAAIQAGADALDEALGRANISTSSTTLAEAAVRAAAALIERAALERAAAEAEKCLRCGKPHEYRQVDAYRHSWAERDVIEAAKAYAHAWDVYANPSRHPGIAEEDRIFGKAHAQKRLIDATRAVDALSQPEAQP